MDKTKPRISITVEQELLDWIDAEIEKKTFANRSHAFEACAFWFKNRRE